MQELYRVYNSKIVKTWSESQKKEWYKIYGMIEALEIITGEEYVIIDDVSYTTTLISKGEVIDLDKKGEKK